jgi:hypothetical protein
MQPLDRPLLIDDIPFSATADGSLAINGQICTSYDAFISERDAGNMNPTPNHYTFQGVNIYYVEDPLFDRLDRMMHIETCIPGILYTFIGEHRDIEAQEYQIRMLLVDIPHKTVFQAWMFEHAVPHTVTVDSQFNSSAFIDPNIQRHDLMYVQARDAALKLRGLLFF